MKILLHIAPHTPTILQLACNSTEQQRNTQIDSQAVWRYMYCESKNHIFGWCQRIRDHPQNTWVLGYICVFEYRKMPWSSMLSARSWGVQGISINNSGNRKNHFSHLFENYFSYASYISIPPFAVRTKDRFISDFE